MKNYDIDKRPQVYLKWILWAVILLVITSGAGFSWWKVKISHTAFAPSVTAPVKPPEPRPTSVTGHYLFNGTIFWGRGIQQWSTRPDGSLDYAHPFSGLASFEREKYDAWEADLECPTSATNVPISDQIDKLVFNCKPEFLPEAAKYFNIINLANNHSDNLGQAGLEETRNNLIKNGMQPVGHYEPGKLEDICEVIGLPIRVQKDDKTEVKATLPVALCAWHYFYRMPRPGEVDAMKRYAEFMPVFAFLHMGVEYKPSADTLQRQVAHQLVDAGADFVIANNPHWVQDSEAYNGKLIVYSTGNFIFDQQYNAEVTRSASVDLTMTLDYDDQVEKWLKLGPECVKYKDSCLDTAKAQNLTKITPKRQFSIVAGDNSGRLTKKGDPVLQTKIEERLKWNTTLSGLTQ